MKPRKSKVEIPKLKKCPFCGSKAICCYETPLGEAIVECNGGNEVFCTAKMFSENRDEAIEMWNRRKK